MKMRKFLGRFAYCMVLVFLSSVLIGLTVAVWMAILVGVMP